MLTAAGAEVGFIDWSKLTGDGGVLHTKFMVVDRRSILHNSSIASFLHFVLNPKTFMLAARIMIGDRLLKSKN